MKKVLKNSLVNPFGFTLVELMVVVAIIGILSSVAVPNFKKYQAKAKQSEAKIQLAAVYSVEVGSFSDYDTYASCIGDLGFDQPARGYYAVGFNASAGSALDQVTARGGTCTTSANGYVPATLLLVGTTTVTSTGMPTTTPNTTAFVAGAIGNIASGSAIDTWSINQAKAIVNMTQGY